MEIRFKNFRCFDDTGFLKLKKITLLVGENSSGKTSFLAGLNHLSALMGEINVDLNSAPFDLGSFKDIYHNYSSAKKELTFEYECRTDENSFHWKFENDRGDPSLASFTASGLGGERGRGVELSKDAVFLKLRLSEDERKILKSAGFKIEKPSSSDYYAVKMDLPKTDSTLRARRYISLLEIVLNLRRQIIKKFVEADRLIDSENSKRAKAKGIPKVIGELLPIVDRMFRFEFGENNRRAVAIAPLRSEPSRNYSSTKPTADANPDGSHVPGVLLRLLKSDDGESNGNKPNRKFLKRLEEFGKNAGLFKKISIESVDKSSNYPFSIMVKTEQGKVSNIVDVGYGVSQVLPVIVDILSSDGDSRFLVQQPEVHLHPKAQAAFGSFIAQISKDGSEFVVETHSDYILDRIKYEIEKGTISCDDVGILFFDTEKKTTKIHQIELDKSGFPKNPPASYRRFFLKELDKVWP